MTTCEHALRTHALADGELTGAIADEARDHLASCETCQQEFSDALQLDAAVAEAPANVISIAWYRQRKIQLASAALAAAAGVAIYVAVSRPKPPAEDHPQVAAIALAPNRGVEARLSWSDAAAYRPYDVPRGDAPHENVPLSVLGDVEKRGDLHGVAVLAMLDGDRKQAASYFERAGNSLDVHLDRAALALGDGDPAKALGLVDGVLETDPTNPVALWNRALALRDLGLPRAAAAAFREVAKRNEPGWAAEATSRAKALDAATDAERDLTIRVLGAGPQLAKDGTGLSLDDAKKLPGYSRLLFYDALRSAPTAERIAKLRPLAEAIDQASHIGDLVAAIERAKPRGALAETYADIVAKQAAGEWDHLPAREPYLAALRAAHADDLLIGALIKLAPDGRTVAADDLPELETLTAASPDPWMQLLGIEQHARVAIDANDVSRVEATLLDGRKRCTVGPAFRCLKLEVLLADAYLRSQRMIDARVAIDAAWKLARSTSEWLSQLDIIPAYAKLADLADDTTGGGLSLARAYTEELRRRGPDEELRHSPHDMVCDRDVWGRYLVANILVNQLRLADARKEIELAPPCNYDANRTTAELRLVDRAHIVAVDTDAAIAAFRRDVDALRKVSGLSTGELAILDHVEGRAIIEHDPKAGEVLLRRSIAAAKTAPGDVTAEKSLGWSYALLAITQARSGDGAAALSTLGEEIGVAVPDRCVVGLAADIYTAVVIRDGSGKVTVRTEPRKLDASAPLAHVADALTDCKVIDVFARPPFHGNARLFSKQIAWRYLSARRNAPAPLGTRRVVVANVEPPASLGLPRLAAWSAPGDMLTGPSATPSSVLAAIADAGEVVVHAHGVVGQLDSSYIALSPDSSGRFALAAREVRAAQFKTSPLVVLAACRSSQAAPVIHEAWSLPTAFVYAGARAVIASSSPMPDDEAARFFDDLDQRIGHGAAVATALRDSRMAWTGGDWVNDLVVFE